MYHKLPTTGVISINVASSNDTENRTLCIFDVKVQNSIKLFALCRLSVMGPILMFGKSFYEKKKTPFKQISKRSLCKCATLRYSNKLC